MTGPEHYIEAERLLSDASFAKGENGAFPVRRDGTAFAPGEHAALIARAQTHALLANAAARALIDETPHSDSMSEYRAWHEVAGSEYRTNTPGEHA